MLTVLFSTYNGAHTLPIVLEAYTRLVSPPGGWKVIAVDNASHDDTPAILQSFAPRLPLTCLSEPRRGKNVGLNAGLAEIEGDLVVLTDDDAIPEPDWLLRLRDAAGARPDFGIFGGPILPYWEEEPEPWIHACVPLGPVFGLTPPDLPEREVSPYQIWGANMAVRRAVFDAGFRFGEGVGPDGTSHYAMGSEVEFTARLSANGYRCWHATAPTVRHIIRRHQLAKGWVLQRAIRYGRSVYRDDARAASVRPATLFGYPRFVVRRLAMAWMKRGVAWASWDAQRRFSTSWECNYLLGQAIEGRELARRQL